MSDLWSVAVPTWLSAAGTVGAFGTGGWLLTREISRDRQRAEQEERAAAGLVVAWPDRVQRHTGNVTALEARLRIRNGGTEPVYQVVLEYHRPDGAVLAADRIQILPPGDHEEELPPELRETWINAGQGWVRRPAGVADSDDPRREPWGFAVAMWFVDGATRRWHRATNGHLTREPTAT